VAPAVDLSFELILFNIIFPHAEAFSTSRRIAHKKRQSAGMKESPLLSHFSTNTRL
jgi:hypothetical protein